jgi:hypothetical protein
MHLLMFLVGFILVIGGLWMLGEGRTVEGLADTSTVVMAVTTGSTSTSIENTFDPVTGTAGRRMTTRVTTTGIFYADIGLTNSPNWTNTGAGSLIQLSGSMGRLMGVHGTENRAYYGTKFDLSGTAFKWEAIPGEVRQISFDYPMVVGRNLSNTIIYITNLSSNPTGAVWTPVQGTSAAKTFNYIAMNNGTAIGAGTDNKIWYCPDVRTPVWSDVGTVLLTGRIIKNMAFDGDDVTVIDTNNTVYFANNMGEVNDNIGVVYTFVGTTVTKTTSGTLPRVMPNWKTLTRRMKQVSIRNHMAVGIGADDLIYFTGNLKDDSWATTGKPSGTVTPGWAELYFPLRQDMITFRPALQTPSGYLCNENEVLQNGVCASKCPEGSSPDGDICIPELKVVPLTSAAQISCTSSPYLQGKKWMCASPVDLTSLLTNPTPTTTYVGPKDQLCVKTDNTTMMYFCMTAAEAVNGLDAITSLQTDFAKTCQTITKSYIDLSNSLTNLVKIQNGMQNGSAQLGTARDSLNSIYNQMNCGTASGNKVNLCNQIRNAASTVGTNSSDVLTKLTSIIPKLTSALGSRDSLLGYKTKFQCPQ